MRPRDSFAGRDESWGSPRRLMIVAGAAIAGCVGADPTPPSTPPTLSAKDTYTQKAWPALQKCVGCHGSLPAVDWMAPGTIDGAYATVFSFQPPVVNLDTPESSLVLTMGKHTGPALAAEDAPPILEWLQKERDERTPPAATPIVVGPLTATLDAMNIVDLGHGATMHFVPDSFDGHLDLTAVDITTTAALHVTHPLFVSRPHDADPIIDEVDHFDDIDTTIAANTTFTLTAATFLDFAATDPFTIHFIALEAP
jgi:hypothetical protein